MQNADFPSTAPPSGQTLPWDQVWIAVVTRPSGNTLRRILADPTARPARALLWVALVGLIYSLLQAMLTLVLGVSPVGPLGGTGIHQVWLIIAYPLVSVAGLALSAAVLRGIAEMLKGVGNINDLLYCLGAVQAPTGVFLYLIALLASVAGASTGLLEGGSRSITGLCLLPLALAASIYAGVLHVLVIDTVEKFGPGKAALTVFVPVIIVSVLAACTVLVIGFTAGYRFGW